MLRNPLIRDPVDQKDCVIRSQSSIFSDMPSTDRIQAFITSVLLKHRDVKAVNTLIKRFNTCVRYLHFLQIIRARYEAVNPLYMAALERWHSHNWSGPRTMTSEELLEQQRMGDLGVELHLEIESFHVFANILLDRIADTVRYYFWRKPKWSHHQLKLRFHKICASRSLTKKPTNLSEMFSRLQPIVDYRHDWIVHTSDPNLSHATAWGPNKKATILPSVAGKAIVEHQPEDLDTLFSDIDSYITAIVEFFKTNIDKSVLGNSPPRA